MSLNQFYEEFEEFFINVYQEKLKSTYLRLSCRILVDTLRSFRNRHERNSTYIDFLAR